MLLDDAKNGIDRKVVYTPFKGCNPLDLEEGIITSVNTVNVFVRYGNDVNSKATSPGTIEFIGGKL